VQTLKAPILDFTKLLAPCPLDYVSRIEGAQIPSFAESVLQPTGLEGGFMRQNEKQVSPFARLAVVAIFLFIAAFAIQSVWHEVKASEERTLNNAAVEYEALKKMYPEQLHTLPPSLVRMNASGAVIPHNTRLN
jgi:hypothetical protein